MHLDDLARIHGDPGRGANAPGPLRSHASETHQSSFQFAVYDVAGKLFIDVFPGGRAWKSSRIRFRLDPPLWV